MRIEAIKHSSSRDDYYAINAVKELNDQEVLIDIFRNAKSWYVRQEVVKKLTDKEMLNEIINGDIRKYSKTFQGGVQYDSGYEADYEYTINLREDAQKRLAELQK
jgi:hypothetical protein